MKEDIENVNQSKLLCRGCNPQIDEPPKIKAKTIINHLNSKFPMMTFGIPGPVSYSQLPKKYQDETQSNSTIKPHEAGFIRTLLL